MSHPVRQLRRALRHEVDEARLAVSAAPPDLHAARRHLKRARSLVRLGRAAWPDGGRRPNRALRSAVRALGDVRDVEARLEAVVHLAGRPETPDPDALDALAVHLRRERDEMRTGRCDAPARAALDHLREARRAVRRARGRGRGMAVFEPGLRRVVAAGRAATAEARRRIDDPAAWHALRRRAKDLRYALEFLEPRWPEALGPVAAELHLLTDRLGDANDLTLVLRHLDAHPDLVPETLRPSLRASLDDARRARWRAAGPQAVRLWAPSPDALAAVWIAWAARGPAGGGGRIPSRVSSLPHRDRSLRSPTPDRIERRNVTRTLVIGGTSLIGRPLVEALLDRGDEVTLLHRSPGTPFGDRVGELLADRNDPGAVRHAVAGRVFDQVYDNVYDWQRGTSADQVSATARAVSSGETRYVFMSSVAVYPEGGVFDEDAELVPASDPNPYAAQKAESERALFALARESGLRVSTLRPAFVYGPHNPFPRESFFWDRLLAGRPILLPGDGSRTMQWVHAHDVARAAVLAGTEDAGSGRAFNVAGEPLTQREYVELLAGVAGVEADLVPVPRDTLVEAGGRILEPPFYFGAYLDVPPITVSGERARELLGLELTPLAQGLEETFAWYRSQDRPAPDTEWEDRLLAALGQAPPAGSSTTET